MCVRKPSGNWEHSLMLVFKRMRKICPPAQATLKNWLGKWLGGSKEWPNGRSQPQPQPLLLSGYAVALLHKACGLSYVAGAPRYKQRGAVFELRKEGRETNFVPVLEGEQVPAGEGCPPLL